MFKENRLKKGNKKLHNVFIFDLPVIKTCLNCKDCKDTCYGKKAEYMYPAVLPWRNTNYNLAKNNPDILYKLLYRQLAKLPDNTVIRIHSTGDFFNQAYIALWYDIIASFPGLKFYAYTKVNDILDFTDIEMLNNFNLIYSFINGKLNYGNMEYIRMLVNTDNAFICPATIRKDIKCNKHCNYCIHGNKVVFKQH